MISDLHHTKPLQEARYLPTCGLGRVRVAHLALREVRTKDELKELKDVTIKAIETEWQFCVDYVFAPLKAITSPLRRCSVLQSGQLASCMGRPGSKYCAEMVCWMAEDAQSSIHFAWNRCWHGCNQQTQRKRPCWWRTHRNHRH